MSRTAARSSATPPRPQVTLDPGPRRQRARATATTGVGFLDHMLDLLARHGRSTSIVEPSPATCRPALTTRPRTPRIVLGQALDEALGDRAGIARYGAATRADGRGAARAARSTSPARPFTLFEADLPPGSTGGFEHELTEEFFRALANNAQADAAPRVEAGTNAHHMIEAAFKAFARALRAAVALDPSEQGVPSTKGTLSMMSPRRAASRSRSSTTGWATAARSRRRSSTSARAPRSPPTRAAAGRRRPRPPRRRRLPARDGRTCASSGSTS